MSEAAPVATSSPVLPGVSETLPAIGAQVEPPAPAEEKSALQRIREQFTKEIIGDDKSRDEKGRFAQNAPAPDASKASSTEMPAEMRDIAPEEFEFAGERFKGRKDAEDKYKTVRGMVKAADARAREALQALEQYQQFFGPIQQEQAPEAPKGFVEAMGEEGWKQYEAIRSEKGEAFANAWLSDRMDKRFSEMLETRAAALESSILDRFPFLQEHADKVQTIHAVSSVWKDFHDMVDETGTPLFPELHEKDQKKLVQNIREIGTIWKEFVERAPQTIHDPYWFRMAIDTWERQKASEQGSGGGGPDNKELLLRAAQQRDPGVVDQGRMVRPQSDRKGIERLFTTNPEREAWGFDPNR